MPELKFTLAIFLSIFVVILFTHNVIDKLFIKDFREYLFVQGTWPHTITYLGLSDWWLISTGSIVVFMSMYRDNRFSVSHMVNWHHLFLKFYFAFTTIVFSGFVAIFFKNIIGRARPDFYDVQWFWHSVPFEDKYHFASFPSGHSTTIAAVAALAFLFLPKLRWFFVALALVVGWSRLAVGVHYPSDVVAGLTLGVVFTWLYARWFAKKRLLFEFTNEGALKLRNLGAERAKKKIRKSNGKILPGFVGRTKSKASS